MASYRSSPLFALALAAALAAPSALAQQVYHWVDENGVSHFSDRPPPAAAGEVGTKEIAAAPPASGAGEEDIYNVDATAARTQARRDQLNDQRGRSPQQANTAPVVIQQQGQVYDDEPRYDGPLRPRRDNPNRPVQLPQPVGEPPATVRPAPAPRSRRD